MEEIWKTISGIDKNFEVSNFGRLRNLKKIDNNNKGIIEYKSFIQYKLASVKLESGLHKSMLIHRLVAIAFIPNPDNKRNVNHKNGIKTDNRVDNLEWVTYSENEIHSYRVLGKAPILNGLGKIPGNARRVGQFINGKMINTYPTATHASRAVNRSDMKVAVVCRGEQKSCAGFQWKYI